MKYESILSHDNVLAVTRDEDTLEIRVSQHCSQSDVLPKDFDTELDIVIECEEHDEQTDGYDILTANSQNTNSYRRSRFRPVMEGVSEGHFNVTAGTGGPAIAKVTDPSKGEWADSVTVGDEVRLSNNHIYSNINKADFGDEIVQPGPIDGGKRDEDTIGEHLGYVPIETGITADVGARSLTPSQDSIRPHALPKRYGQDVHRSGQSTLKGEELTKTGRTTGVRWGDVKQTGVSANVRYGGDIGTIPLKDMIIVDNISTGGDSGSPVFHEESGDLVGQVFAGNDNVSIVQYIKNVEDEFGVKMVPFGDTLDGDLTINRARPDTRTTTGTLEISNQSKAITNYFTVSFEMPDEWEITDVNNANVARSNNKTTIYVTEIKGNSSKTIDVTFKASENANTTEITGVLRVVDGVIQENITSVLDVADDWVEFYDTNDDGKIKRPELLEAISDYNDNKLPLRTLLKLMSISVRK